jgi:5-methylcytosine-specific restriction enzyme subunit McrC
MMREPRERVRIQEWSSRDLSLSLSDSDRLRLAKISHFVTIDELRNGVRVVTNSHVGVIKFDHFDLEIIPKLPNGSFDLVDMLMFTHGMDTLKNLPGLSDLQTDQSASLLDIIALLFCHQCERIVRNGLRHDYVTVEEDLPVLRGRLQVLEQVRRHRGQIDHLACEFDDHQQDILDNQVLRSALEACRSMVTNAKVRLRVNRMHSLFVSLCSPLPMHWRDAREDTSYHRMNEDYQTPHAFAWLLLGGAGIDDLLAPGNLRSFAFCFDMNKLFETFVANFITRILDGKGYIVSQHARSSTAIWNHSENKTYTTIDPDLVVISPTDKHITIDSKYKRYDEKTVSTSDVYQSFLYTLVHAENDDRSRAGMIIHPNATSLKIVELHVLSRSKAMQARLFVVGIPIVQILRDVREKSPDGPISAVRTLIVDLLARD